jgi:HK97 family phage major capsid protein
MPNLDLTLDQAREKMATRQDELGKVFTEAKSDNGTYDFKKVSKDTLKSVLGDEALAGKSIDIAKRINEKDAELNELGEYIETLEASEKAAGNHAARGKVRGHVTMPEGDKGRRDRPTVKSLGELLAEEKDYQDWVKRGHLGTLDMSFDALPSDILAKGMAFDTLGTKALMSTTAGYAPESVRLPGFTEMATRPIQLLDIIPMNQTGQAAIKFMEETTRTHAAAEKAEGAAYAESTFVFTERSSDVRKITDSLPVTDEQFDDVPMMEGYVNGRLTFGIRQRFDGQVYVGDGNAPNLRGIVNVSGIQTQAKGADPVPDAFFKAMTKVRVTGRAMPTHHVMHPTDWQGIRLLRTADGVYIWGSPSEAGPERLWGLPVVQNDARAAGSGMTGSFQPAWISAFERSGVDIQVGYVNAQFGEGKKTVRGDIRVALVVFRPAAFCDVTGL